MSDVLRRNKGRLNHLTHVKVADPLGIFTVSLLSFMWLSVFRVRKSNKQIILLQDIKNRDPVFAGGFHTNVGTIVFSKPINQLLQPFGKGREASLLILGTTVCISNPDASIDPCFVANNFRFPNGIPSYLLHLFSPLIVPG